MVSNNHFLVLMFLSLFQLLVHPSLCTRQPALRKPFNDAFKPYQPRYERMQRKELYQSSKERGDVLLPRQNASSGDEDPPLAQFGQVVPILGAMQRTDQDFVDGLALDLFAPSNRTVVVQQNLSPLDAAFVEGTTGGPFVPVANYSYIVKVSDPTPDLIAKIELPYDPAALAARGLDPSNTYVGRLNPDGNAWRVLDADRNVHIIENKTRIIKLTSLDGEYRLLARATADTSNIFLQYGAGATRTFNITGGGRGVQEAEWIDGLRVRVRVQTAAALALNADIRPASADDDDPSSPDTPPGVRSVNAFRWAINVSDPAAMLNASIRFPVNLALLNVSAAAAAAAADGDDVDGPGAALLAAELTVGRRELDRHDRPFQPVDEGSVSVRLRGKGAVVRLGGLTKLDGEYVLLKSDKPLKGAAASGGAKAKSSGGGVVGGDGRWVYWQLAAVALYMFLR